MLQCQNHGLEIKQDATAYSTLLIKDTLSTQNVIINGKFQHCQYSASFAIREAVLPSYHKTTNVMFVITLFSVTLLLIE